jgi:hypothetical protein
MLGAVKGLSYALAQIWCKSCVFSSLVNTKGLQTQVSSLQNKLNAKNQTPGASKSSARSTNKKGIVRNQSPQPKKGAAPATAPKADAAANGSNDKHKNYGRQKQQPKKKKSKQPKPN